VERTGMDGLQALFMAEKAWLRWLAVLGLCVTAGLVGGGLIAFLNPFLAAALAIALAGALLMLRDIKWGLYALVGIICLLPFATLPIRIGFVPTFLDLVLAGLFFAWLARLTLQRERKLIASPVALPLLLFVALAFASFVAGLAHARLTATVLRRFLEVLLGIGIFFLVVNSVNSPQDLERVIWAVLLAGFAEAFLGVVLYFLPQHLTVRLLSALGRVGYPTGWGVLRFIEDNPELPMRATATSIDPNVLGGLLILVTALAIPQLLTHRSLWRRALVAAMVGTMGFCLYLTFSRGSLLGLGAALAFLGLFKHRRFFLVLLVAAVLVLILPQAQGYYIQHLMEGIRGQDLATKMRFGEYKDALILISRYPWIGVGFAGTPDIDIYIGVSSVYLLIAEEMGLIGLGAFLATMGVFFSYTWRAWKKMRDERVEPILLGVMASLVGALVGGIFDHYLFNLNFPHAVTIFWLYVGLGVAAARLGKKEEDAATSVNTPPK